jgi:hypothetical protein
MKKLGFKLGTLLLLTASVAVAQQQSAVDYLTFINNEQGRISADMMQYISAANHGKSARKVEKRRLELLDQIKQSEQSIRKLKPFNGNHQLRDSIAQSFRVYQIILKEEYGKIVNMEEIAEQSYDAMEAYLLAKEKAGDHMDAVSDAADREFNEFASANKINIVEGKSKVGQKLALASEVNHYQNQIYLIFFKSYLYDKNMMEALEKGDINAVEQNRNALLTSTAEALTKLGPIQPFKGDGSTKNTCQQLLNYYKAQASTKIPDLIDFVLAKENFEKTKKAFDSRKPTERTQDEVNAYNKAVSDYNAKANKSNQINREIFEKKGALLKAWNDSVENFLNRHTPR